MADPIRECEITLRVRYAETDPMGVVHHARYFFYFDLGRTELLRRAGMTHPGFGDQGVWFVIVKATCQYKAPARYDDELRLVTRIERMTRSRIDYRYELFRVEDGRLLCTAETVVGCVDRDGAILEIPAAMREASGF